jgi:hypothetical protein
LARLSGVLGVRKICSIGPTRAGAGVTGAGGTCAGIAIAGVTGAGFSGAGFSGAGFAGAGFAGAWPSSFTGWPFAFGAPGRRFGIVWVERLVLE